MREGARQTCKTEMSRDRKGKAQDKLHRRREGKKGKLRGVKEKETEKCLKWTQKTQKMYRIKEYVMMVWYGSTMPGLVVVRKG